MASVTWLWRFVNRRLAFAIVAIAVLNAKVTHIHSHVSAVPSHQLRRWGLSFFAQDIGLLLLVRLLLDHWVNGLASAKSRFFLNIVSGLVIFYNAFIAIFSVSFYLVAGSEVRWSNAAVATDPTARAVLVTGLVSLVVVTCLTLLFGWLLQNIYYAAFGYAADIVNWPLAFVARKLLRRSSSSSSTTAFSFSQPPQYDQVAQQDDDIERRFSSESSSEDNSNSFNAKTTPLAAAATPPLLLRLMQRSLQKLGLSVSLPRLTWALNILAYLIAGVALLAVFGLAAARPKDGSLTFLQWTAALLPFVDFSSSSPTLEGLQSHFGTGIQRTWDSQSALSADVPMDWLPEDVKLAGFEDWYQGREHYSADADPMKISNLEEPLLPELRDALKETPIKHVILLLLESTRHDIFPIKKDGLIWNRLAETWPGGELPDEVVKKLETLTPNANYITGDYDDGFAHDPDNMPKRGGPRFTNAHTAGTYTLKSMVGTICGIGPLVADFNLDYQHHIYQPCLPQIFEAFNHLDHSDDDAKWQNYFFQAATLHYDNHDKLMETMGFPLNNTIDHQYLRSEDARHGAVTLPKINAFGTEEDPLEDYIRDAFVSAKDNNERVFLTHITSTSHHAFKMPEHAKYTPVANGIEDLSHYVNAESYDDGWIRKILDLLDEQGVANETLVVFLGDHGLSMPENDITSPYYNPSIGIDHVPLVLSHPNLPSFDVHSAVHSSQVLPTILDMLLETNSLDKASRRAAEELVRNYEGQSLVRPLIEESPSTGQGNWQFTLVNPGRAVLTVRDARFPERHLIVPVIDNVEWRLSNVTADPREQNAVQSFDFVAFLGAVEERYDEDVARWVEEGAFMSRWWVEENAKRWRYGPYLES